MRIAQLIQVRGMPGCGHRELFSGLCNMLGTAYDFDTRDHSVVLYPGFTDASIPLAFLNSVDGMTKQEIARKTAYHITNGHDVIYYTEKFAVDDYLPLSARTDGVDVTVIWLNGRSVKDCHDAQQARRIWEGRGKWPDVEALREKNKQISASIRKLKRRGICTITGGLATAAEALKERVVK